MSEPLSDWQSRQAATRYFHGVVPTDLWLYPGEQIDEYAEFALRLPPGNVSAEQVVLDLTHAQSLGEVGLRGAADAAGVAPGNEDDPTMRLYDGVRFFRDAHIFADILRPWFPMLTRATVIEALEHTGVRDNLWDPVDLQDQDEQEIGKVPHELRDPNDPIAQRLSREKDWGWPYFGAIDTTAKNVNAIVWLTQNEETGGLDSLQERYMGLDGQEHTVEEGLASHMDWIRGRTDLNPEGLVECQWVNKKHHANQSWTDSPDSAFHADGSWAQYHPEKRWGVAQVEVQAEAYDALMGAANVYRRLASDAKGERRAHLESEAQDFTARAVKLRRVIMDKFWVDDPDHFGGFFARGTDRDDQGNLRPLAVRSSDMGHLLASGILDGDDPETIYKREAVIRNLFSPEMLCINGIRTLSSDSARYWPDRYHGGSSWPWQTYYIAHGLERHGYYGLALALKKRVWDVYQATGSLPEFTSGSNDPERLVRRRVVIRDPTIEGDPIHPIGQPAQNPQAWTAAAVLAIQYELGYILDADLPLHFDSKKPVAAIDPAKRALEIELLGQYGIAA